MHIRLRPWHMNDLQTLVSYANNIHVARNMMDKFPHPYNEEHGKAFISFANSGDPIQIFAIELNAEPVGGIGVHPQDDIYRKNAELGYWLAEPFWGKGIVPEAVRLMVSQAFKNFDIERIFARPFGSNTASQKVLEKCGFNLEARLEKTIFKNGMYEDELIYALRRENHYSDHKPKLNA